jgi:hypothetical protein
MDQRELMDPDVYDAMDAARPIDRHAPDPKPERIDPDFAAAMERELRFDRGEPVLEGVGDVKKYAQMIWESPSMDISGAKSVHDITMALLHGMEAGLTPTMVVKNVYVVNGRPAIWGDCLLGLCQKSGQYKDILETYDQETQTATCKVVRLMPLADGSFTTITTERTFSREDADTAGLTGRGVHRTYPIRMLQQRARGFALRDAFADVLSGLHLGEDVQDFRPVFDSGQMQGCGAGLAEAAREASDDNA